MVCVVELELGVRTYKRTFNFWFVRTLSLTASVQKTHVTVIEITVDVQRKRTCTHAEKTTRHCS